MSLQAKVSETYHRVNVISNAFVTVRGPSAHSVVRVGAGTANSCSQEITPSFTHTTTFAPTQATRIFRTASHACTQTVTQFVNNNTSFEITITVRKSSIPEVHPHAAVLPIRRSHEVGVVESGTILGISNDCVIPLASSTKVILLEVACKFVKTISKTSSQ